MKPLVAITGRRISGTTLNGLDQRWAAGEVDMFWAEFGKKVAEAGGIPIQLPYESAGTDVVERIDALVVTGGQDIDPVIWGGPPPLDADNGEVLTIDRRRDDYEIALVRHAIRRGIPILGICRGHQVLNVALGGTLIPHLPKTSITHVSAQAIPDRRPDKEHPVDFTPATLAARLYGPRFAVNSWHHQAVADLGDGLIVSGRAPDGVVEAIELPGRPVLGLQWHPEAIVELDPSFEWVVEQARAASLVGELS
ncbi:gamma-glutamyl-gamma-aminobutyrate hydrolase family protein [Gordonia sp. TBRC 11910]|uniref:Gamma-glutamyl-gamma-aminobutyrate hydrolase family protein n=1 Tax=Gordonia asplenii TaxID=2725283 RepID=A0A848L6D4_9ACTN|nr:gamma-glutamyl-gamma-aminobutyrate hydrolase family protein [Gordonia asplenii]NMO03168.1 gamma-glutamyl-gamma-aminobutyrate hydrolase family protein [Gordonia asplenii]